MDMWIQLSDYSSDDKKDILEDIAKKAFQDFDWVSAIKNKTEENDCDPGFGLLKEDESLLHICPVASERCYVHYTYKTTKKILGFIPISSSNAHYIESCSFDIATKLIEYHFAGKTDEIIKQK